MVEIRFAACKLMEIAGVTDPARIRFAAGGGAFLESLKISRGHSDKDWKPEECPTVDPEKAYLLLSRPIVHDAALPTEWLAILIDGVVTASAHISLSPGCSGGIPAVVAEISTETVPEVPLSANSEVAKVAPAKRAPRAPAVTE